MADTITLSLDPDTAEQLRRVAEGTGESLEVLAQRVLTDVAAGFFVDEGEDEELKSRIDEWERTRESIPADEVHAYLRSLFTDNPLPPPIARKPE